MATLTEHLDKSVLVTRFRVESELIKDSLLHVLGSIAVLQEDALVDHCAGYDPFVDLQVLGVGVRELNYHFDD